MGRDNRRMQAARCHGEMKEAVVPSAPEMVEEMSVEDEPGNSEGVVQRAEALPVQPPTAPKIPAPLRLESYQVIVKKVKTQQQ